MRKILFIALALSVQSVFAQLQPIKVPVDAFTAVVERRAATLGTLSSSSTLSTVTWQEQPNSLTATTGIRTFVGRRDGKLVGTFSYNRRGEVSGEIQLDNAYDMTLRNGYVDISPRAVTLTRCGVDETAGAPAFGLSSYEAPRLIGATEEGTPAASAITDGKYRRFRLAILVSSTDFDSPKFGGSVDKVKSWLAECEAFLNALYVRDLGIEFKIVDDERLIKTSLTNRQVYLENATEKINGIIGADSYDVGVVMSWNQPVEGQSGAPNIALLRGCLHTKSKGDVCVRDQTLVAVAHELGHHFGAYHTFVGSYGNGYEPNPGQSTMGYNGAADFFGKKSLEEMVPILKRMDTRMDLEGRNHVTTYDKNSAPVFDLDKMKTEYTIPENTFFTLDLHASDPDGDAIIYGRQQESSSAVFPTRVPAASNRLSFGREYGTNLLVLPGSDQNRVGTYDFSFYVNDGTDVETNMQLKRPPLYAVYKTKINIVPATPFKITNAKDKNYVAATRYKLTWDVDANFFPAEKKSKVRILMSDDGGKTFKHILMPRTDNDGECEIYFPTKVMPVVATLSTKGNVWDEKNKKLIENADIGIFYMGSGLIRIETIDEGDVNYFDTTDGTMNTPANSPKRGGIELKEAPVRFVGEPQEKCVAVAAGEALPEKADVKATAAGKDLAVTYAERKEGDITIRTWTTVYDDTEYGVQQFIEQKEGAAEDVKVAKIILSESDKTVAVGETFTLSATVEPANATNKDIAYMVEDETIVQNLGDGTFMAMQYGETTITAQAQDGTKTEAVCQVKVTAATALTDVTTGAQPRVEAVRDRIVITGIAEGTPVQVIDVQGRLLHDVRSHGRSLSLDLNGRRQLVLVKIGDKTYKKVIAH